MIQQSNEIIKMLMGVWLTVKMSSPDTSEGTETQI